jgi:hypothetical protein
MQKLNLLLNFTQEMISKLSLERKIKFKVLKMFYSK